MAESIVVLELQGRDALVDADSYRDALDSFLALLRELDATFTQQAGATSHSIKWFIHSLHTSNPTVELLAEPQLPDIDVTPMVIHATLDSLETLQRGPIRPENLTYAGLERCLHLGGIIRRDSIAEVTVKAYNREVRVTDQLDVHVRELIGQKIEVLGSVEGELEMVTLRGRRYFNVYSVVTGKATRCYFEDTMRERIRAALGHVVTVRGLIRSFAHDEGQEMIEIADLVVHPDEESLPAPEDIRGIWPDFTSGKPSERYLKERWRGES
jgi:hypothetical protein